MGRRELSTRLSRLPITIKPVPDASIEPVIASGKVKNNQAGTGVWIFGRRRDRKSSR